MSAAEVAVLVAAGLGAGFLNTLAGGGSVLTLPALEFVTGSPGVANATNRIAILLQNVAALQGFGKTVDYRMAARLSAPFVLGGAAGAYVASMLDAGAMRVALSVAVALVAAAAIVKPPRAPALKGPAVFLAFFGSGFYAGFVQAGVGFLLLACLAGGLALDLVRANAVKVFLVLLATVPALVIFGLKGQLWIVHGLVVACGNMTGAAIASRLAVKKGAAWVRWVVVVAAALAIAKLLFFPSG
ncbi:MAG: sulfite exporter TauE/SafE family protein [Planctomycetota bacterium]